jgi:replication factor C subunit 3/5
MPHLLFYGPPGTGKTSTILACARKINGPRAKNMVLELNASDDRGIGVVRDQIKSFAESRQLFSKGFKLVILDEADAMTNTAQFALRRVIEQYAKTTRFCLICNYINKIIPALQSRCTRFRFGPLAKPQVEERLREVAATEGVQLRPDGLKAIIKLAAGDMRKCLNVMQSAHLAYPQVDEETVYACTGNPMPRDIKRILDLLLNHGFREAFGEISDMQRDKGLSLVDIVTYVHERVLRVSLPDPVLAYVLDKLSDLEYRLTAGVSETLQLGALVAIFQEARHMTVEASS